jgi:hypothetical protein
MDGEQRCGSLRSRALVTRENKEAEGGERGYQCSFLRIPRSILRAMVGARGTKWMVGRLSFHLHPHLPYTHPHTTPPTQHTHTHTLLCSALKNSLHQTLYTRGHTQASCTAGGDRGIWRTPLRTHIKPPTTKPKPHSPTHCHKTSLPRHAMSNSELGRRVTVYEPPMASSGFPARNRAQRGGVNNSSYVSPPPPPPRVDTSAPTGTVQTLSTSGRTYGGCGEGVGASEARSEHTQHMSLLTTSLRASQHQPSCSRAPPPPAFCWYFAWLTAPVKVHHSRQQQQQQHR